MSINCARCDGAGTGTIDALPQGWELHTSGAMGTRYAICAGCVDSADGKSIRAASGTSAADDRLRLFIERVERLEEEKRGISDDIRDVYSEAKSVGYDATMMREVVRLRRMSPHDRAERDAILDTYRAAMGL